MRGERQDGALAGEQMPGGAVLSCHRGHRLSIARAAVPREPQAAESPGWWLTRRAGLSYTEGRAAPEPPRACRHGARSRARRLRRRRRPAERGEPARSRGRPQRGRGRREDAPGREASRSRAGRASVTADGVFDDDEGEVTLHTGDLLAGAGLSMGDVKAIVTKEDGHPELYVQTPRARGLIPAGRAG